MAFNYWCTVPVGLLNVGLYKSQVSVLSARWLGIWCWWSTNREEEGGCLSCWFLCHGSLSWTFSLLHCGACRVFCIVVPRHQRFFNAFLASPRSSVHTHVFTSGHQVPRHQNQVLYSLLILLDCWQIAIKQITWNTQFFKIHEDGGKLSWGMAGQHVMFSYCFYDPSPIMIQLTVAWSARSKLFIPPDQQTSHPKTSQWNVSIQTPKHQVSDILLAKL